MVAQHETRGRASQVPHGLRQGDGREAVATGGDPAELPHVLWLATARGRTLHGARLPSVHVPPWNAAKSLPEALCAAPRHANRRDGFGDGGNAE